MFPLRLVSLILLLTLHSACVRMQPAQRPPSGRAPATHSEPSVDEAKTKAKPPGKPAVSKRHDKPVAASPAVVALMRDAEESRKSGQFDNAAATLERAIRLQSRNPLLWQKLASVRLEQGQPGLAEEMAKKSNVLAKGDGDLMRTNWKIIAEARRRKGDVQGADEADVRSERY